MIHLTNENFLATAPAPITEASLDKAVKCDTAACALPYCFCSKDGTRIPGDLEPSQVKKFLLI